MAMNGIPDRSLRVAPIDVSAIDLGGELVAVVGGTDGLGRAIARLAAVRGAEVTVVGRTFRDEGVERIAFVGADLSSMREAERMGAALDPSLDALILTTGIFAAPEREVTDELLVDASTRLLDRALRAS